jgi:hypothetical protein
MINPGNITEEILSLFENEFGFLREKFEIMDLLANGSPFDYKTIEYLKLPSEDYNIVWHPGVYVFIGNNKVYRVGVSMRNSRSRVMEHIAGQTSQGNHCILDIDQFEDKSILLFNVKNREDGHWLLSLETYFEKNLNPLIRAKRIG